MQRAEALSLSAHSQALYSDDNWFYRLITLGTIAYHYFHNYAPNSRPSNTFELANINIWIKTNTPCSVAFFQSLHPTILQSFPLLLSAHNTMNKLRYLYCWLGNFFVFLIELVSLILMLKKTLSRNPRRKFSLPTILYRMFFDLLVRKMQEIFPKYGANVYYIYCWCNSS